MHTTVYVVSSAHMYVIDYDRAIVYEDKLSLVETLPQSNLEQQMRLEADLASRLTSPVISTIFNAKQLAFQRCVGHFLPTKYDWLSIFLDKRVAFGDSVATGTMKSMDGKQRFSLLQV